MNDFIATALGLGFALVVCLLAVQAILGPWLRIRRKPLAKTPGRATSQRRAASASPETTAISSS